MDNNNAARKRRTLIWATIILAALTGLIAILVRRWRARQPAPETELPPPPQPIHYQIEGLSEAEAEFRKVEDQENVIQLKSRRTPKEIWQDNTLSIFNLSLIGIAFVQLLLGKPLDALLSVGVMFLNIGLNTAQELIAKRRLQDLEISTQSRATVIREGATRSIDPNEIVVGDALVAGPGDYIFIDGEVVGDGQLVMDESMLSGRSETLTKRAGDPVYAGSFCVSGRSAFLTQKVGYDREITTLLSETQAGKEELTDLEHIIDRILRVLLGIVAIFTVLLLATYFSLDIGVPEEVVIDAASVIFNIAPASLFFMILLTYAGGTADLAKLGALVHRARSVESLAQVDTICFARDGILTGTHVEIEDLQLPEGVNHVAESRIRQILGDYARSTSLDNFAILAMANSFEGNRREIVEETPFMSVYGWSAVAFNDNDLRGIYVLGDAAVLEGFLAEESDESTEPKPEEEKPALLQSMTARVSGLFRRSKESSDEEQAASKTPAQSEKEPATPPEEGQDSEAPTPSEDDSDTPKPNIFKRVIKRVNNMLRPEEESPADEDIPEEEGIQQVELLFAYIPALEPLHDSSEMPNLPTGLIPLCKLRYSEKIRPEAIETIKEFQQSGVRIKIFSAANPNQTAALLKHAGLGTNGEDSLSAISGPELAILDHGELVYAADENAIFGNLTPAQAGQVVQALRREGQIVAVLGDGVNDMPALRQANLAITRQSSSQAALSIADIVLLEDSPQALQRVLEKGQRVLNGLLDILKLYLTQAFYLTFLILSIGLFSYGFPFKSIQNTVIATITVTIPSVGLSFWASSGVYDSDKLWRYLVHFFAPAAITMGGVAFLVYRYFLDLSGEVSYAQLTVTYTLVITGLLLVIFVKPPIRAWAGGSPLSGDWRTTWLVIALLFAYILVVSIPFAQELLKVGWLQQPAHILIILLVAFGWAFTLRLVWRIWPLEKGE